MSSRLFGIAFLGLCSLYSNCTSALTVEQFSTICDSADGKCSDHPILEADVGGALDLLATLGEGTGYLNALYCKEPKELFDVPAIIRFMRVHREGYATRNPMLLVVRYVEENDGCQRNE